MIKKLFSPIPALSLFFLFAFSASAQNILLLSENFQTGGASFTLNGAGVGSNSGINQWVINNQYTGGSGYPNTMRQDSTYSGTISFAPYSQYLHIRDMNSAPLNATFDPTVASDRFTFLNKGVCTMSMSQVEVSFFYLCEGNAGAYGEVYYSRNGGPWTKVGLSQYNNKYKWKFESIMDPAFDNCKDLRIGFRWINSTGSVKSESFSVDDVNIVGFYDQTNNPVTINITNVTPNPVCQGANLFIFWSLSDTLCDGTYEVELSNSSGSFSSAVNLGVFNINYPQTSGAIAVVIPSNTPAGNCYKVRINRLAPPPVITGTASVCFIVQVCPNTITTLQAAVLKDPDTVCAGSVIDVPFYSKGVFAANNNYIAQLSDSAGNFGSNPTILGTSPDSKTYDPNQGSLPGNVSGLIPNNTPAGCNYYIRVVSTNPVAIGTLWGPFCIKHCDMTTNNQKDLHVCVTDCWKQGQGWDTIIPIKINMYNNNAVKYFPGNQFQMQVLDSKTLAIINTGVIGKVTDTTNCLMKLHIPCADSLGAYGLKPGMFYIRVIATNCSPTTNSKGTIIRLTIGAPKANPPVITPNDTAFCIGEIGSFLITPYNPQSQYTWTCNGINNGQPFVWGYNPLLVNFGGGGSLTFTVYETNFGCKGPTSAPITVVVKGPPVIQITGPLTVCKGDTNTWSTQFYNNTYYTWSSVVGVLVDTTNSTAKFRFDSVGTFFVKVTAINECGSKSIQKAVIVYDKPLVNAGKDSTICQGTTLNLSTTTGTGYSYSWSPGGLTSNSISVTPTTTTTYIVTTTGPGGCKQKDTVVVTVNPAPIMPVAGNKAICLGDSTVLTASGANTYSWSPATGLNTTIGPVVTAIPPSTTTYTITGTSTAGCTSTTTVQVIVYPLPTAYAGIDVTILQGNSTILLGTGGGIYSWTPSTGLSCTNCQNPTASPTVTTTYILKVMDLNGCAVAYDSVTVYVELPCTDVFVPNVFSPDGDLKNDVLYVLSQCIKEMTFSVYDRWGNKVFETNDVTKGWDGTYKGQEMNTAVFVWYLEAVLIRDEQVSKKGNVTLLRTPK